MWTSVGLYQLDVDGLVRRDAAPHGRHGEVGVLRDRRQFKLKLNGHLALRAGKWGRGGA